MDDKVRLTVVALLPIDVKYEDIPGYIDQIVAREDPTVIRRIYRTAAMENKNRRFYVKISKSVIADEVKDGWYLRITERFGDTGCDDVAWKITEIEPWDTDSENTTESVPVELFRNALESDTDGILLPEAPSGLFGSDAFWEYFDYDLD